MTTIHFCTGVILGAASLFSGCGAGVRENSEAGSAKTDGATDADAAFDDEQTPPSTQALYRHAISDAAVAQAKEVRLLKRPEGELVTVLSWVNNDYLSSYPVGSRITLSWGDVWVTLVPEVLEKCREFPREEQQLRLQQLLGLPPNDQARSFVVMEARIEDLFRPCIHPDVHAERCAISGATNDEAHALFFANQTAASYTIPDGYPWTRLGYTYDWNPDTPEYGASEYVVKKDASVMVKEVLSTSKYCQ